MKKSLQFQSSKHKDSAELTFEQDSILFHGGKVDDRSTSTVDIVNCNISRRCHLNYDFEKMEISIGGESIDADNATDLFATYFNRGEIILDATTLGFAELFLAIKSLIDLDIGNFLILYVEPAIYNRTTPGADSFALSELNAGYKSIPRAVIDLAEGDVEAGVFFLGYEQDRIARAFEDYQMLSGKDIKVVFGIPAFQPGWELNSIVPHLDLIEQCDVAYCAANDPSSAYDTLEDTLSSLGVNKKMFIAPIGTKPCGIASALFASLNPARVGLLYDHRKKKIKRSSGTNVWHKYRIHIKNM